MAKDKLVIVSTRLPISVSKENGKLVYKPSAGGLAAGVSTVSKSKDSVWIGWPGISSNVLTKKDKQDIINELKKHGCHPVFLNDTQIQNYYFGYSNTTLWPLFHYFTNMARYEDSFWRSYQEANELFCTETIKFADESARVWVHDYQLMLLPKMLRNTAPRSLIGFFLHTPFPSYEIFRQLPQRRELLEGLLGADLVGFHTYDYVRHFLTSISHGLGLENHLGSIKHNNRVVKADAFPIGIDYKKYAKNPKTRSVKKLVQSFDIFKKHNKIILAVDRADYSKGIPARLDAYELFLQQNQNYHGKVVMILLAVPSRENVQEYQQLRETIEQKVSRINGNFSTVDWSPISYRYQSLPFNELIALYSMADVMMVTPLRDGMNLVAKEYVASHHKSDGVLVLSEMAGAASELSEAIQVNPNDTQQVSNALVTALKMPAKEQKERMRAMQRRISTYTISTWADDYIGELEYSRDRQLKQPGHLRDTDLTQIAKVYKAADKRLILLDYDGTLKNFVASPSRSLAHPSSRVRRAIRKLTDNKQNRIIIVSGRPKNVLESFFETKGLGLIAEHGGWVFDAGNWVKYSLTPKRWKRPIKSILEKYTSRTPGSIVEEKDFALVWHYRNVSPDLAFVRKEELKMDLQGQLSDSEIGVFEGNKIIEIKPKNMHKGAIVAELLSQDKWDFIMAIGDDYTDEDMFRALPERSYSIRVGGGDTAARYQLDSVDEVINLLANLK